MINSLFSQNSYALPQTYNPAINAQKMDALKSILSNYDANNLSGADVKNIASQVKDLGIAPGRTVAIFFAGQGFDGASIGREVGVEGKRSPSPLPPQGQNGPKGEVNTVALSALTRLMESKNGDDVTETEWSNFYEDLDSKGVDTSRPIIDLKL